MSRDKTISVTVTRDWQQVSDGTDTAQIQFYAVLDICRSPEKPASDAAALRFKSGTLTLTPPDQVWARTVYDDTAVLLIY